LDNNNSNLASWADSVQSGVSEALREVVVAVPDILAAVLVLLIGVVVAAVLKALVVRVLRAVKLQPLINRVGLNQVFQGKFDIVELLGDLVKWFFIIVFLLQALTIAHLERVNDVVSGLLAYVPNVLVAAALVFVGFVVADLTSRLVSNAAQAVGGNTARLLGNVAKYAILTVVTFTALAQLGVNTLFLERLFTAIVAMLALAGGLAFGLGGRDLAKDVLDGVRSSFRRDV
jgi:small-conductance mechanosensitive channel